mmetsp:Transcript_10219/g.21088  ORF Transcript_10219/g.21088 Transcript_10219/m.21088 type:complete len:86 (-) Transcript_10219:375-632(-)
MDCRESSVLTTSGCGGIYGICKQSRNGFHHEQDGSNNSHIKASPLRQSFGNAGSVLGHNTTSHDGKDPQCHLIQNNASPTGLPIR